MARQELELATDTLGGLFDKSDTNFEELYNNDQNILNAVQAEKNERIAAVNAEATARQNAVAASELILSCNVLSAV